MARDPYPARRSSAAATPIATEHLARHFVGRAGRVRGDAVAELRGPPVDAAALVGLDSPAVLLGVRHHSPACAAMVRDLIRRLAPREVLVEGPSDFDDAAALQDPELRAPVALFAWLAWQGEVPDGQPGGRSGRRRWSGWFPLCGHSPELVAFREAARLGVEASFCDLDLWGRAAAEPTLLERLAAAEVDLGHRPVSAEGWLGAVQERLGARDQDEAWDRLFELSPRPPEQLAEQVAIYGALLRRTAPVQPADHRREAFMAARLREALDRSGGPVVLVCGAMHLPGVREALEGGEAPESPSPPASLQRGVALIPYSFPRMAGLRYAAGMPAPAWDRAVWRGGPEAWAEALAEAARAARREALPVSTAELEGAHEMALRLAGFRGLARPGRGEVSDAVRACWVKGSMDGGQGRVLSVLERSLIGDRVGRPGPRAGLPPLARDVDRALEEASLGCDGASRSLRLRPRRAERDRERAEVLARLTWLGVDYGRLERGPDLLRGERLERVEQVWTLGWTPESRSRLLEASAWGATLHDAALARLEDVIEEARGGARGAVDQLVAACAMGFHPLLGRLGRRVARALEGEARIGPLLSALHRLVMLARSRDALGAVGLEEVDALVARCWERALWLLPELHRVKEAEEDEVIEGLRALGHGAAALAEVVDSEALLEALDGLRASLASTPGVMGAVEGLLLGAGRRGSAAVGAVAATRMRDPEPEAGGRFLGGLLATARRRYIDDDALLDEVSLGLVELEEEALRRRLPRLRRVHADLTPGQSARLAQRLARRWGGEARALRRTMELSPVRLARLGEVDRRARRQLGAWGLAPPPARAPSSEEATSPEGPAPAPGVRPRPSGVDSGELLRRWRLVLGRFAAALPSPGTCGSCGVGVDQPLDETLGFLYDREYAGEGRGMRMEEPPEGERYGGSGPSQLVVPEWINRLERLFPKETAEALEAEALGRYGLTELVTDPRVLARCTPSVALLEAVLRLQHRMEGEVLRAARRLARAVAEELAELLRAELSQALSGRLRSGRPSRRGSSRSFDPATTLRRNLRHYDPERGVIVVQQPWFRGALRRSSGWRVILCVDQSGSMLRSTIHAGVAAAAFAEVPELEVSLVTFDTRVVDLSEHLDDPVKTLLSVQLGGGTDIAGAVGYCAELVRQPSRTLMVLVSDLYEGGDEELLVERVARLTGGGVKLLVLAALDEGAEPAYDRRVGRRLVEVGARVSALTPGQLARWVGETVG